MQILAESDENCVPVRASLNIPMRKAGIPDDMNDVTADTQYALGHSDKELIRLERQGQIFGAETREILRHAGLAPGMKVLDVGCGVGDVSLIAAELVGPTGKVTGIDNAENALALAKARASRAGYHWIDFETADLYAYEAPEPFDAVIGRFILMHVRDAVEAVKLAAGMAKPRGVVSFIELDVDQTSSVPELPLLTQCAKWVVGTYRKAGAIPNMGAMLYPTFRSAGLSPRLAGSCRIESGPDSIAYEFVAESLRSLLPAIVAHGIATAEEVGVDTIAARLRDDTLAGDHAIFLPRLVGAWATIDA